LSEVEECAGVESAGVESAGVEGESVERLLGSAWPTTCTEIEMIKTSASVENLARTVETKRCKDDNKLQTMIKTRDLGKTVSTSEGQLTILKGIDLEIKKSESVAIVGASGSGKTTLLSLLAGLDTPSRGSIFLGNNELTALDEEQRARVRGDMVGFVFQTFQLLGSLTAIENVMLPAELKGDPGAADKARVLLERVGLEHRNSHYPRQLSGGEQQRVAIARAFASSVEVLFADEPTGNLDTKTGAHIIDLIFDLNREFGTTLVLVTHDLRLADRCDRSIVIESGELVEGGA